MITHTISIIELIWTLVAVLGCAFSGYVVCIVIGNYQALQKDPTYIPDGPRAFYARGRIRTEVVKLVIMIGFIAIGIAAMMTAPTHSGTTSTASVTIAIVLISSSLLMTYDSILYIINRDRLLYMMRRSDHEY